MIDSETRVLRALTEAADAVRPPADILDRATAGGRRQVRRRRALLAGAVALLVAVIGGGVAVGLRELRTHALEPAAPLKDRLLTGRTLGDLAGDSGYLRDLLAVYQRDRAQAPLNTVVDTRNPLGAPHVVWAGNTPAGPAAVVAQKMWLPGERSEILIGYFGPGADGSPVPEAVAAAVAGGPFDVTAFVVGHPRKVLVVLDGGRPVDWSAHRSYGTGGITRTDWKPLRFVRGAAVVEVPEQHNGYSVAVRNHGSGAGPDGAADPVMRLANNFAPLSEPEPDGLGWGTASPPGVLPWQGQPARFPIGTGAAAVGTGDAAGLLSSAVATDGAEPLSVLAGRDWLAYGRTAGGLPVIAGDLQPGGEPARSVAVVQRDDNSTATVIGPVIDKAAPFPVLLRLPDGLGWLVARKGATIEYRTGDGAWHQAGPDAALLPPTATLVRGRFSNGDAASTGMTPLPPG